MGTDIQKQTSLPTPTPQHDKSLSPQALQDHRALIAFEVRVALSAYFQPHEAEEVRAAQLAWWTDELQEWTLKQVVYALRQWNRENPRLRPTPGDILSILLLTRGKREAERAKLASAKAEQPLEPREELTPERRAEIQAELDGLVDRMRAKAAGV